MATTNPVFQVLTTSGNQGLLAAGNRPTALAVGQAGIFNIHTGLSIDGTDLTSAQDFEILVGVDPENVGSIQDVIRSAGQMIQTRHSKAYTYRGYVANLPKIVDVAGYSVKCQGEYAIKLEFRNSEVYALHGYNPFLKTFTAVAGCCPDPCEDCADGDTNGVTIDLVNQINNDPDKLVTATYVVNAITATVGAEPTASGNIVVTIGGVDYTVAIVDADTVTTAAAKIVAQINTQADSPFRATNALGVITIYPKTTIHDSTQTLVYTTPLAGLTITTIVPAAKTVVADPVTFLAANPGVVLGFRLTTVPVREYPAGDINIKYYKSRGTDIIVSLIEGFTCNGSIDIIQELQHSEGRGYDLKQQEYEAGGWNGKPGPYRQSTLTGLAREGFQYYINPASNYNQIIIEYDIMSVGGWEEYLNNLKTIIAVPCADGTTLAAFATVLDLIFANRFNGITTDVAANGDCTNVATSTLSVANSGISSLA